MPKCVLRNMERDADAGSGPESGPAEAAGVLTLPRQAKAAREGAWAKTHRGAADSTTTEPPLQRDSHSPLLSECKFQKGAGSLSLGLL